MPMKVAVMCGLSWSFVAASCTAACARARCGVCKDPFCIILPLCQVVFYVFCNPQFDIPASHGIQYDTILFIAIHNFEIC